MQLTASAATAAVGRGGCGGRSPCRNSGKGCRRGSAPCDKRERSRHEGEGGVSAPWSGSGLVQARGGRRRDPDREDQRRDEADTDGGHVFRSSGGPEPPVERFALERQARVKQGGREVLRGDCYLWAATGRCRASRSRARRARPPR